MECALLQPHFSSDILTSVQATASMARAAHSLAARSSTSYTTSSLVWQRRNSQPVTKSRLQLLADDVKLSRRLARSASRKDRDSRPQYRLPAMCTCNSTSCNATPSSPSATLKFDIPTATSYVPGVVPWTPPKSITYPRVLEEELAHFFGLEMEATSLDDETMGGLIKSIRTKLKSMDDGETLASIYDTAWVARVPAADGSGGPQFPKTVQWILDHQLKDGSWGEEGYFLAYDRIINTLACVIALKTWNAGNDSIERGVEFIWTNTKKLENEADAHMLCGFEVVFTAMLEEATRLDLDLPYQSPFVKKVVEARERKLQRIPVEVLHTHPTTLLYSLEGLESLVDWERIMKLQSKDGSFLSSPASTACALIHTGDSKCLEFLATTLASFNNEAVPCHYPIDLFERLWLVDTIGRLGIASLFEKEIRDVLDYVYRYWTPRGIGWARELPVQDIDDTAMAFRLFRLYGYDVSADVFEHFKQDGKFFCFAGECRHGVSEMLNLYRASQVRFPGEKVLEEAYLYSRTYLENAIKNGDAFDKWSLKKDLPGEVAHALKYPWHKTLPRFDARTYMDHYGADDVWLAKTIYLLPSVNNKKLKALSTAYFNRCQAVHQREVQDLLRWWQDMGFAYLPSLKQNPVESYFTPAATLFEPEFYAARSVVAKASILAGALSNLADDKTPKSLQELQTFSEAVKRWEPSLVGSLSKTVRIIFKALYETVNEWVKAASRSQGQDVGPYIRESWENLVASQVREAEWAAANYTPSLSEIQEKGTYGTAMGTVAKNAILFCGETLTDDILAKLDDRSSFMRTMCLASLLSKDTTDHKGGETLSSQRTTAIKCYMRDHPGVTEEEALASLRRLNNHTLVELTYEFLRPDNDSPMSCRRVIFDCLARSSQFLNAVNYNECTNEQEAMEKVIEKILIEPAK